MKEWPETEQVLARFRNWLDEARVDAEVGVDEPPLDGSPVEPVGLYQLVERLTSLRHEVKLVTKASRSTEERNEATLLSMQAAIEQFRSVTVDENRAREEAARPLVEGLADLDESLRRGRSAIENARRTVVQEASGELTELREQFEQLYRAQAWWRRVLCRPWHAALQDIHGNRTLDTQRRLFDSLLEGYDLIQTRLQRTLSENKITRMQCMGRQVDPNSMTVVETVSDPGRPSGQVVQEVRTGYYWQTKVLRFAEVKAVGER